MLALLLTLLSPARADRGCAAIHLRDLVDAPTPGVIILGESPGYALDLRRAARVVRALRDRGQPVTLALEVLPVEVGGQLASLAAPDPDLDHARAMLHWDQTTALPFAPYRPLLALGLSSVPRPIRLVAVGQPAAPTTPAPAEAPAALVDRLSDLAGPGLPYSFRLPLAAARAATDAAIAETALAAWDGRGTLVIVADRTRVAGDGGLPFQVAQRTPKAVTAATLDWRDLDCVDSTLQWQEPTLRLALPAALVRPRSGR